MLTLSDIRKSPSNLLPRTLASGLSGTGLKNAFSKRLLLKRGKRVLFDVFWTVVVLDL